MKVSRLLGMALAAGLLLGACSKKSPAPAFVPGPDVVARVNGVSITTHQVDDAARLALKDGAAKPTGDDAAKQMAAARKSALEDLINRELVLEQCKIQGFSLPEQTVYDRLGQILREDYGGNRAAFLAALKDRGYTLEQYAALTRDDIMVQTRLLGVASNINDPVEKKKKFDEWMASLRKDAVITIYQP